MAGAEFLTILCALYSFIDPLQYRSVKEKKHFQGEGGGVEESWCFIGGGVG